MGWICSKCGLKHYSKREADKCCSQLVKGDWEQNNLKEHECIFCMRKSGQKTLDKNLPFRGHFICSVCFEKKHKEDIIYG